MMGLWMRLFRTSSGERRKARRKKSAQGWESLEQRQLLTSGGNGVDYVLNGFSWSNPAKITYSIPSDGINWDYGTNNLNATLNSAYGDSNWVRDFAKAIQTWAASANINVVPVADNNARFNAYGLSQGDPNFGDIRVGGYNFNDPNTLAETYPPPPNGQTAAGDVEVNTAFNWAPGAGFDFYSVMLHETGHSLGLDESPQTAAVMYQRYGGVRTGLSPFDVEGIQALYGARVPDPYAQAGQGTSFNTAIDVSSKIQGTSGAFTGVWLTTIGSTEYYSITVPAINGASLQLTAAAAGLSSLSPKITVYDASMNLIGSQSNPSSWSDNVSVNVPNTASGQHFLIAVTGATNDVFAVGAYQLQFAFTGGTSTIGPVSQPTSTPTPPPVHTPSPTPTPQPQPLPQPSPVIVDIPADRFEPNNTPAQATNLGVVSQLAVTGLSLNTTGDVDYFVFQTARAGNVTLLNTGGFTRVINDVGQTVAAGTGQLTFKAARAGSRFLLVVTPPSQSPVASYAIGIDVQAASNAPARRKSAPTKASHAVVAPRVTTKKNWSHARVAVTSKTWKTP